MLLFAKEKIVITILKTVRHILFMIIAIDIGPTAMGPCTRGERLGSISNTIK